MSLSDLHYDAYEVSKDAHYRTRNKDKYQYTGNAFFEVCILTKKVSGIEQEAYKEYNA